MDLEDATGYVEAENYFAFAIVDGGGSRARSRGDARLSELGNFHSLAQTLVSCLLSMWRPILGLS